VLRNIIGERARDGVLQQPLISDEAIAVDRFHLAGVKIHRHHADGHEHTQNYIQNGDT